MEKRVDFFLLFVFVVLLFLGILILASVSSPISLEKFGTPFYYLIHQLLFGILPGIFLGTIAFKVDFKLLKKYSLFGLLFFLGLSSLVFLPTFRLKLGGGARWIKVGPIVFQPSEFLKLAFCIYLAAWLSSPKDFGIFQTFLAFVVLLSAICLIFIFQPDISTLGIIMITSLVMFFLAKTPLWQTIFLILMSLLIFSPIVISAPYRLSRILVFLNPEIDPMGIGYQIRQSLIAIGSGKIFGKGLGLSQQKFGILPKTFSDLAFAVFAEETGFLGAIFLISLYLIFFFRSFKIGSEKRDEFSKLLAFGISFWIVFQAFFHIGSNIGVLPLSGIPLPFISYGGSHLVSEIIGTSLLLKITKK